MAWCTVIVTTARAVDDLAHCAVVYDVTTTVVTRKTLARREFTAFRQTALVGVHC